MTIHDTLLKKASQWASECFQNTHCATCIFHDYSHTKEMVAAGKEIAEGMQVSADELETVLLACWLHDLGLLHTRDNHEAISAQIAEDFLTKHGVSREKIKQVKLCILATKIPQRPNTILENIVCDADISHLGKDNYFEKNTLLRQELRLNRGESYSDVEWWELNKVFLQEHQYFTPYAHKRYSAQKKLNLNGITKRLKKSKEKPADTNEGSNT